MYLLNFLTGFDAALVAAATKTVGGVERAVDATGTVANDTDTSEDVDESTGCIGSKLPWKSAYWGRINLSCITFRSCLCLTWLVSFSLVLSSSMDTVMSAL